MSECAFAEDFVGDSDARTQEQQTRFQELIMDSFDHPEQLRQEIPWLVTDSAVNGYQFGHALAERDSEFRLLAEIVDCKKHRSVSGSSCWVSPRCI